MGKHQAATQKHSGIGNAVLTKYRHGTGAWSGPFVVKTDEQYRGGSNDFPPSRHLNRVVGGNGS